MIMTSKETLTQMIYTLNSVFETLSMDNPHRTNIHTMILMHIDELQELEARETKEREDE